ncbi:MAG: 30S ribosomal protein S20 [Ignavibacteriales bacterium]|jgi:small subunit ribosomal protein S20|nr:30S ribosomal protein S20 [Ignavibacteriales bacterium]
MANHKSAKKRIRSNERKRVINRLSISKMKTLVRKALETTEKSEAEQTYREAVAHLDRIAAKGRIHKNNAARKKSRLTRHLNEVSGAEA